MKFGKVSMLAGVGFLVAALASSARAIPVEIDMTSLRAIQTFNLDKSGVDQTYLLVSGVANGQAINERIPKDKTWEAGPKKPAITAKAPAMLWKGDLAEGQFALVSVTVMQGTGQNAALQKQYLAKLDQAQKRVAELSRKTLSDDEAKAAAKSLVKAQQAVIEKIKDLYSREKKTDHFNGLFDILVRNEGGKIVKRLDPVGLTFGEHFGTDAKLYTKLKNTRNNVFVQAENGEWSEQSLSPLSDDKTTIRVKMLETEYVKTPARTMRNVTDYLADMQVKVEGKPTKWSLAGEEPGEDEIHVYWDYAK